MEELSNINTSEHTESECPVCGVKEWHVHIQYETDDELVEWLDTIGAEDYIDGKLKKIIYDKVPVGRGTSRMMNEILGPILDMLCKRYG